MKQIEMADFEEKLINNQESIHILDVRSADEFASGHIAEAINLPVEEIMNGKFPKNKSETYYIICHSGARSVLASKYLQAAGYDTINIRGGMMDYKGSLA